VGWTAGAGIEGAFTDHWAARLEYLFVDLQNSTFTPIVGLPINVKFNTNLHYKFSGLRGAFTVVQRGQRIFY
jgi:opacity protein-like surface antigen